MASLLGELRRRNVFKVGAAYVVVAWLLIQVADTVFPAAALPAWTVTFVTLVLVLGFPVAIILAWAYEVTPQGIKPTKHVPLAESIAHVTGQKLNYAVTVFLVLAVGFMAVDTYLLEDSGQELRETIQPATENPVRSTEGSERDVLSNSIAVLPFDNLSPDPDDAYFSAGIHEQIITELAKLGDLNVIGRTSVMAYAGAARPMTEIADELRVEMLMEGSVRYAADQVRVTAQLIDGATGTHIWNDDYDGDLTDIFAIQSEIATAIADALQATLSPQEGARLSEAPTQNARAYDFYLRGKQYRSGDPTIAELAAEQYQLAVEEDPEFALAWARLAFTHFDLVNFDRTDRRRRLAFEAADRALELEPDIPEAHFALTAYYMTVEHDYEQAQRHATIAAQAAPGDPEAIATQAWLDRRQGRWQQALTGFERALELDPRNGRFLVNGACGTYQMLRNYDQADACLSRALEIAPDVPAYATKALIPLRRDGDFSAMKAAAENPPFDLGNNQQMLGWFSAVYERDYRAALDYLEALDGDYVALFAIPGLYLNASLYGVTHTLAGQTEQAERSFTVAEKQIAEALAMTPEDHNLVIVYGEILAGLGESEAAIGQARRAMELMPASLDALVGSHVSKDAIVRVLIPAGAHDMAIEALDAYLSAPGDWSIEGLLPDPRLDPIRDDPRFQNLLEKYARN